MVRLGSRVQLVPPSAGPAAVPTPAVVDTLKRKHDSPDGTSPPSIVKRLQLGGLSLDSSDEDAASPHAAKTSCCDPSDAFVGLRLVGDGSPRPPNIKALHAKAKAQPLELLDGPPRAAVRLWQTDEHDDEEEAAARTSPRDAVPVA